MSIFSCLDFIEDIPVLGDIDSALSGAIDDFGDWLTGSSSSSSASSDYDDDTDDVIDDLDDDEEIIIIRRRRR